MLPLPAPQASVKGPSGRTSRSPRQPVALRCAHLAASHQRCWVAAVEGELLPLGVTFLEWLGLAFNWPVLVHRCVGGWVGGWPCGGLWDTQRRTVDGWAGGGACSSRQANPLQALQPFPRVAVAGFQPTHPPTHPPPAGSSCWSGHSKWGPCWWRLACWAALCCRASPPALCCSATPRTATPPTPLAAPPAAARAVLSRRRRAPC